MNVTPIQAAVIDTAEGGATPLADRFAGALARSYVDSGADLAMIKADSNDPAVSSNPVQMFALQTALADYSKRMIVAAGLANHATKTVETLLKS